MRIAKLIASGVLGGGDPTVVSPPPGWTWTLPFTVHKDPATGTFNTGSWDVSDEMDMTGGDIYVGKGGSDAQDGTTYAKRKLTINAGMTAVPENGRVLVYAGKYGWSDGMANAWATTKNVSLIGAEDGVILDSYFVGGSWTLTTGQTFTHQCAFAVGAPGCVFDYGTLDVDGAPIPYTLKTSIAEVEALAGSYYWASNVLYVRPLEAGSPDADVRPQYSGGSTLRITQDNRKAYIENIMSIAAGTTLSNASAAGGSTAYFKNCKYFYNGGSGGMFPVNGIDCILQGVTAAHGPNMDIVNGNASNTVVPRIIEIGCKIYDAGKAGDTASNASTNHGAGWHVVINGEYYNTYGPPIGYIQSGYFWLLGAYSHHNLSTPGVNDANYQLAGAVAYLDTCRSSDSGHDITAEADVYVRNFTGDSTNNGAGSVIAY